MASAPIAVAPRTVAAAVRIRVVEFEEQRLAVSSAARAGGDIGGQRGPVSSADQMLEELCLPPPRPRPFKRPPRQLHQPAPASTTGVSSLECSGSGSGVLNGRLAAGLDADTVRGLLDCLSTQRSLPDDGNTAAVAAEAASGGAPSTDNRARRHHRKLRRVGFAPMTWRRRLRLSKGVGGGDGDDSSGKDDGGGGGRDLRLLYPLFRSRDSLCVTAAAAAGSMLLPILVVHSNGGCAPHSIVYGAAPPSLDVSPSMELAPTVRGLLTAATSSQPPPPPPPSARNAGRPSVLAAAVVKTASVAGRGAGCARDASRIGNGVAGAELGLGLILARASSFADARSGRSWRRPAAVQNGGASAAPLAICRRGASPTRRRGDGGLRVDPSPLPLSARPRAAGALGDEISVAYPQTSFALSSASAASGGGGGSSRVAEALDAVRRAQLLGDGDAEQEKDTATNDSEERPQQRRQLKKQAAGAADGAFPPPTAVGNCRPGSGRWARCRDGATLVRVVLPTFSAASATAAAASELSACETRCASSALSAT